MVTIFVLCMNLFMFGYLCFDERSANLHWPYLAGSVLHAAGLVSLTAPGRRKRAGSIFIGLIFITGAIIWATSGNYLIAALLFIFSGTGFYANRLLIIHFSTGGITYPSFPEKFFHWEEVSQAILKDGILTIDLKNNQLLQFSLGQQVIQSLDENAFNRFCSGHITKQELD